MPAIDLLVRMQATRTHMALVIDEYGGTDGLVSIEDLVEMVVGDIEDEHDEATEMMIVAEADGTFVADARASLDEVKESLGIDLQYEESAEDIDTIGGFIVTLAGPRAGPQRTDPRTGQPRIRDSRRRSAPDQARPHLPSRVQRRGPGRDAANRPAPNPDPSESSAAR